MTEDEVREFHAKRMERLAAKIRAGEIKLEKSESFAPLEWAKHPDKNLMRVRDGDKLYLTFEFSREFGEWSEWHEPAHPVVLKEDDEQANRQSP